MRTDSLRAPSFQRRAAKDHFPGAIITRDSVRIPAFRPLATTIARSTAARSFCAVIAAGALLVPGPAARAATVLEAEATTGVNTNNTLATAQFLNSALFTPNADPNVFGSLPTATVLGLGGGDVDFFSFSANAGIAYFDIDDNPETFDTMVSLFDANGTLIGFDDDSSPADPGSENGQDSFLGVFNLPASGTYYVAVSQFGNYPNGYSSITETNLTRPDGEPGGFAISGATFGKSTFQSAGNAGSSGYTLNISLGSPAGTADAPLPSAAWGGLAILGGWALTRIRRRRPDAGR